MDEFGRTLGPISRYKLELISSARTLKGVRRRPCDANLSCKQRLYVRRDGHVFTLQILYSLVSASFGLGKCARKDQRIPTANGCFRRSESTATMPYSCQTRSPPFSDVLSHFKAQFPSNTDATCVLLGCKRSLFVTAEPHSQFAPFIGLSAQLLDSFFDQRDCIISE